MVDVRRTLLNTIGVRRGKTIEHLIRQISFFKTVFGGKIEGKGGRNPLGSQAKLHGSREEKN